MTSILGSEWHLSSNGIDRITENGSIKDYKKVLDVALNADLKEIGSPVLATELSKEKTSKIVLQIQKIRNISAPKANEESHAAPRMLKLNLTDGDSHIQALEIATINSISRSHTPPGTKLLVNNAKIISGYILLNSNNCTVLGGKVPHLVEKWEIAKSIQRNKRGNSAGEDGPPPWVNFGMKIQAGNQDGTFKSLGNKNKDANKDSSEFEIQRQGAIAEATSGAVRKVFGGRVKQNVQPTTINQNRQFENGRDRQERGKNRFKSAPREREIEEKPSKPSEKVSLFSFLEDKLPLSDNQNTAKSTNYSYLDSQNYPRNQANVNKNFDTQVKLYNNPQKGYQNYNQQNKKDYKQGSYNRNENTAGQYSKYEKNLSQQSLGPFNSPKHFEKPQSNDYLKQFDKPNNLNSNTLRPYDRPQQQQQIKRNDTPASNSKSLQSNNNVQREKEVNDLTNNISKVSLNSQFASRSLRQHLNLGPPKKNEEILKKNEEPAQNTVWNIGDECLAKYWEDGKFYNAIITAVTDKTYAVKFKGYGNIEEILKTDCLPVTSNRQNYGGQGQQNRRYDQNNKAYAGSMEFRRSTRNFK